MYNQFLDLSQMNEKYCKTGENRYRQRHVHFSHDDSTAFIATDSNFEITSIKHQDFRLHGLILLKSIKN